MKTLNSLIFTAERLATRDVAGATVVTGIAPRADAVVPGSLFFAVRGAQADGHAFVADALRRGAAAVVVEREEALPVKGGILVPSTRAALASAASRWFDVPSRAFSLVGITGTNGKTTTSFLLRHVWTQLGLTSGLFGTVEYRIGDERVESALTTPDPLALQGLFARLRKIGGTVAAMEVSSIALDQQRVGGSQFAVGVFTNFTQDHLDYHGDMERYYEAKRRLFVDYALPVAVLNADDPIAARLARETTASRVLTFGMAAPADFSVTEMAFTRDGIRATLKTPNGPLAIASPLIGRHNLSNLLAAVATEFALDHDLAAVARALEAATGAPGRLERVPLDAGKPRVFVDYAHTDDALENVLQSLVALRGNGRVITVFGCGGDRDRSKRPKMARVASRWSNITVATSDNPRTEDPQAILDDVEQGIAKETTEYHREVDRRRAIAMALELAGPDDLVLIAGKGHETYQILGHEKFPFDDREIVAEHYRQIRVLR